MPGYVSKALHRFQHPLPKRPQHSPHAWQPPQYGQKIQLCEDDDTENPLSMPAKQRVQQIVGTFLYYALVLDFTMLVALGSIAQQTSNPTEHTMSEIVWFLDYCASHPDAKIRFNASDMHLWLRRFLPLRKRLNEQSRSLLFPQQCTGPPRTKPAHHEHGPAKQTQIQWTHTCPCKNN